LLTPCDSMAPAEDMGLPASGIYAGSFSDVLDSPEGELSLSTDLSTEFERMQSCDSHHTYASRTEYKLQVADDGSFTMSRQASNDCEPSLDEFEGIDGRLKPADPEGSFELVFQNTVHEKMQLELAEDSSYKLRAMVEGAGPGAAPHPQEIKLRRQ